MTLGVRLPNAIAGRGYPPCLQRWLTPSSPSPGKESHIPPLFLLVDELLSSLYQFSSPFRNPYMKYLYRISLCLLVLLTSSCLKDFFIPKADPKVFSCKINGQIFLSRATILTAQANATIDGPGPPYRMYIYTGSNEIDMTIKGAAVGTGVYEFSKYFVTAVYTNNATGKRYRADSLGHGNVTLENFHPAARYITGTFWFNAVNIQDPTDSVKVTEGHFYITKLNKRY
jgi:hypothetical protein